ncbi:MAG: hypothetical protein KAI70_03505, partial [Candidatus Omnitrophica bacterium]|nr:hypothetical protein [Candidatus Omnitrophota bacterium]
MKKIMKKIISILIAFTFLVNNVSFALSPGLKFNVLGQEVPYQEFLVLAEIGLQSDLQMLDSIVDIDGTHDVEVIREAFRKNERFKMKQTYRGDVKGNLTEVIAYFNLVQHSSGNMFTVPVSVEKGEQRKDYKLLFSTERDVDNGYPTTLYEVRDRQREKKDAEITGKIYDKRSIAITGITGE